MKTVSGSLFYRERIALPPDAEITVLLAFRPAGTDKREPIGLDSFTAGGKQAPFSFAVPYDASAIDGRRNYFIHAEIKHSAGKYCFSSVEPVYVITHDRPTSDVDVMLRQVPVETRTAVVTGTVSYRERVMLPPDSVLTVRLQDVSRADAPAVILGEQIGTTGGKQVPLPFSISYNPTSIDPRFSYSISARIEDGNGILRFISDTNNPVITRENPSDNIEVWVRALNR